jgi:hypothetical protein
VRPSRVALAFVGAGLAPPGVNFNRDLSRSASLPPFFSYNDSVRPTFTKIAVILSAAKDLRRKPHLKRSVVTVRFDATHLTKYHLPPTK